MCNAPPHIKGPDARLCGAKLAPVAWLAFELVCSFQAAPLEAGQSDCSRLFTSAEAFRVPAEARNSCVLSCFDRGSLRPIQSKMGWAGRKRREINDKTRHQSVAPERSHVTHPSHMWVHCTLLIHAFTPYMHPLVNHTHTHPRACTFLWIFQGEIKLSAFLLWSCNWVTRKTVFFLLHLLVLVMTSTEQTKCCSQLSSVQTYCY